MIARPAWPLLAQHLAAGSMVVIFLLAAAPVCGIEPGTPVDWSLFPVPASLESPVQFWMEIFAHYDEDQWLIHDEQRLDIVWTVVDGEIPGTKAAKRRLSQEASRIQKTLLRLAAQGPDPTGLSEDDARILDLARALGGPAEWKAAAGRIRIQAGLRGRFIEGVRRSGLYGPGIRSTLAAHGVPQEIAALPHVESSYNFAAYSKVGAAGVWQFMRSTGRRFITVNDDLDERRDPIRATDAAARYLRESYDEFGSWPLAITSYNHGQNGIRRAVLTTGSHDLGAIVERYHSPAFGFASRNFYAEFVAVLRLLEKAPDLLPGVVPSQPVQCAEIPTKHFLAVKDVLKTYGVAESEFRALNPAVATPVIRGQRRIPAGYVLRLPVMDAARDGEALYAKLPQSCLHPEQVRHNSYTVRRGDSLSRIARRCGTSVGALASLNGLGKRHLIFPGQKLRLPGSATEGLAQQD